MISKEWDQSLKFLTKTNPQSFVSLLLNGATFLRERERELESRTFHADLVYEVQWYGENVLLHAEFQSRRHKMMARRVWEYNVLLACTTQLPVLKTFIGNDDRCCQMISSLHLTGQETNAILCSR